MQFVIICIDRFQNIMRSDQIDLKQFLTGSYWDDILCLSGNLFNVDGIVSLGLVSVGKYRHQWVWNVLDEDFEVSAMFQDEGDMCIIKYRLPFIVQGDFTNKRTKPSRYYFVKKNSN